MNPNNFNADPYYGQSTTNFNAQTYGNTNPNNFNANTYPTGMGYMPGTNMNAFDPSCTMCAGSGFFMDTNQMRQNCGCRIGGSSYAQPGFYDTGFNIHGYPQTGYRQF
jgi:hypothetical protein